MARGATQGLQTLRDSTPPESGGVGSRQAQPSGGQNTKSTTAQSDKSLPGLIRLVELLALQTAREFMRSDTSADGPNPAQATVPQNQGK